MQLFTGVFMGMVVETTTMWSEDLYSNVGGAGCVYEQGNDEKIGS